MADETLNQAPATRQCIACREQIPADAAICSHCLTRQAPEPPARPDRIKTVMMWVGYASGIIGLGATLFGIAHSIRSRHQEQQSERAQIAQAQSQLIRDDPEAAFHTYQAILKSNPQDSKAAEGEAEAAMAWLENFSIVGKDEDTSHLAAEKLDEIFPVLDAALVRSTGTRKADVLAHIGWAHWLNQKIAEREFGDAALQNLRAALAIDPANVYANAMLANLLLQRNEDPHDALALFQKAEETGKDRQMVRAYELGAMVGDDTPGLRTATIRVVNDMRKNNEPMNEDRWYDIFGYCYDPIVTTHQELAECLSAVPPDESWATYQQIASHLSPFQLGPLTNDYAYANLLEISGRKSEALAKFHILQQQLKNTDNTLHRRVDEAVKRLS